MFPTPAGLIVFSIIVGIATGANSSLIQTISVIVLPNPEAAAKDLGFLNLANTLGGVGASFVAASVIGQFGYGAVFVAQAVVVLLSSALFYSIKTRALTDDDGRSSAPWCRWPCWHRDGRLGVHARAVQCGSLGSNGRVLSRKIRLVG